MRISQISGRERGEENLARVRRYLAGLKTAGQSLPLQDGRPNITAIAEASGVLRNVFYTNAGVKRLLAEFIGNNPGSAKPSAGLAPAAAARAARPAPAAVRGDRPGPPAGTRPHAAAERRRHLRRRPGRPRPARRPAARLRPAGQDRRPARPPGRGEAQAGRHGHLPDRRAQRGLPAPACTDS